MLVFIRSARCLLKSKIIQVCTHIIFNVHPTLMSQNFPTHSQILYIDLHFNLMQKALCTQANCKKNFLKKYGIWGLMRVCNCIKKQPHQVNDETAYICTFQNIWVCTVTAKSFPFAPDNLVPCILRNFQYIQTNYSSYNPCSLGCFCIKSVSFAVSLETAFYSVFLVLHHRTDTGYYKSFQKSRRILLQH